MKIKYTTTREVASILKSGDSNCGSSLRSLVNSGMSSFAFGLSANRIKPVEDYMQGEIEVLDSELNTWIGAEFGPAGLVLAHFRHCCVIRRPAVKRWSPQINAEIVK